jgi:cytoskeletal protein CcmA (bactofilin family)
MEGRMNRCALIVSNENGFVLVTALIMMFVLTAIMTGAYLTTANELAISGNYKTSKMAFYQADAGVQYTLRKIRDELNGDKFVTPVISPKGIELIDPTSYGQPTGYSFTISAPGLPWSGNGPHTFVSTGSGPNNSSCSIRVQFMKNDVLNPAFTAGLLSDGDITIHGSPNITGNIHANGDVTQTGSGTINGSVSANGTASVGAAVTGSTTPNADRVDVPSITDDDFANWRTKANTSPNIYVSSAEAGRRGYYLSLAGDLGGKIIFIDGDVNISSDISNATIIATGDITINGSTSMSAGSIGIAMIAGGDITFDGSSTSYGVFWCNGSYVHNGSGTVTGSVVAKGDITRNGSFNFQYNSNISNNNLPKIYKVSIASWVDSRYL